MSAVENAVLELRNKNAMHRGLLSFVPDEETPAGGGKGAGRAFSQRNYGMDQFCDLFTSRQLLSLTTIVRLLQEIRQKVAANKDTQFSEAVVAMLALALDRQADFTSSLCSWWGGGEKIQHTFSRQALPIVWDFAEGNPWSDSTGCWTGAYQWGALVAEHGSISLPEIGHTQIASATAHPLPNDTASAFISDPPYYDAVPYADLSDFFYVWLRRTLSDTIYSTLLTPKDDECIVDDAKGKDQAYFEITMRQAMAEGRRVLAPNGIGIIVFAHKSTSGWEAQLQEMIEAGWIMTGSWPIDTEMETRLRAMGSAALASSVHLVCRPRESPDGSVRTDEIGDWRDVLQELPGRIHDWMPRLAEEGVVGADAIFACLGPALEIFSRYSRVEKASGEVVTLKEYLEHVWAAVSKEALSSIIANADLSAFEPDARLTAMWLWTLSGKSAPEESDDAEEGEEDDESPKAKTGGGFSLEYDTARKIAQGLGAHLEDLRALVEIKGDQARLLPVSERTAHLFGKEQASAPESTGRKKKKSEQLDLFAELTQPGVGEEVWEEKTVTKPGSTVLDRIHQSMILFATGRSGALKRFLVEDGIGQDAGFWKLAQALSALYPPGTQEKRWVDGVLARKKGLGL